MRILILILTSLFLANQNVIAQQTQDIETITKLKPHFREKRDKFSNLKSFRVYHKSAPKAVNTNGVFASFVTNEDYSKTSGFVLSFQYCAREWLFINCITLNFDGKKNITLFPVEVKRDCGGGGYIWEWGSIPIGQNNFKYKESVSVIEDIINAETVEIRFNGSTYYKDKVLTEKQKKAIKETYDYYKALGGIFYQ